MTRARYTYGCIGSSSSHTSNPCSSSGRAHGLRGSAHFSHGTLFTLRYRRLDQHSHTASASVKRRFRATANVGMFSATKIGYLSAKNVNAPAGIPTRILLLYYNLDHRAQRYRCQPLTRPGLFGIRPAQNNTDLGKDIYIYIRCVFSRISEPLVGSRKSLTQSFCMVCFFIASTNV